MRAEGVILHNTAPVRVDHLFACLLGADAVFPVVFIRKTAARPAQHRQLNSFQRFHNIGSHAVYVWNVAVFANINAVINAASEVLGKIAVDIAVDLAFLFVSMNGKFCHFKNSST